MALIAPDDENALLAGVDRALEDGLCLKRWWEQTLARQDFPDRFDLRRSFNPAGSSYGYFGVTPLPHGPLPVMGLLQEMAFDASKPNLPAQARDEIREFVLHYFMRVSSLRQPEGYPVDPAQASRLGGPLSWCPTDNINRIGFGFSQLYYKMAGTGEIGRIPAGSQYEIVDLREIGPTYDWILAKVQLYAFNLNFHPFGPDGPGLSIPLNESQYILLSPHFIVDDSSATQGAIGRYHLGYALLKNPGPQGLLAYGPGEFRAGFQTIEFTINEDGAIHVCMAFLVDQPRQILNVPINPFTWSIKATNLLSLGLMSGFLNSFQARLDQRASPGFDPVGGFIDLANLSTGGLASRELCISMRTLEVDFLVQHFMQHYEMIVGAQCTWNQVANWLQPNSIPEWAKRGVLA
jgi:hypothetical protein